MVLNKTPEKIIRNDKESDYINNTYLHGRMKYCVLLIRRTEIFLLWDTDVRDRRGVYVTDHQVSDLVIISILSISRSRLRIKNGKVRYQPINFIVKLCNK